MKAREGKLRALLTPMIKKRVLNMVISSGLVTIKGTNITMQLVNNKTVNPMPVKSHSAVLKTLLQYPWSLVPSAAERW